MFITVLTALIIRHNTGVLFMETHFKNSTCIYLLANDLHSNSMYVYMLYIFQ